MDSSATLPVTMVIPTQYSTVAAFAVLVYDYVLTFDAEIEFVWTLRWSFGKVLFIVNRYFGLSTLTVIITVFFLNSLPDKFCEKFMWWESALGFIAILNAEIILIARIYAVYDLNKKLLVSLGGLFLAEITSTLVLVDISIPSIKVGHVAGRIGCNNQKSPPHFFISWIPALIFEVTLFLLMLYKGWRTYKDRSNPPLLHLIIRDSILYFLVMFMTILVNCIIWAMPLRANLDLQVAIGWAVAVPCALGSRLLLNMRQRCFREQTSLPLSGILQAGTETHVVAPPYMPHEMAFVTEPGISEASMAVMSGE